MIDRAHELAVLLAKAEERGAHVVAFFPEDIHKPIATDCTSFSYRALNLTTNTWSNVRNMVTGYMLAQSDGTKYLQHLRLIAARKLCEEVVARLYAPQAEPVKEQAG